MNAEAHLRRCVRLLDELAGMGSDPAAIDVFLAMADEVEAGMQEVDDDTDGQVVQALEMLAEGVSTIGAAGLAAGVIERARVP